MSEQFISEQKVSEQMMPEKVLLSLVVSPMVEDAVVDLLLENEAVSGFTSYAINGHGVSIHSLSPAEQVSGRQRQILFQTYLPSEQLDGLITQLSSTFSGSGIHYWVVPLLDSGRIK